MFRNAKIHHFFIPDRQILSVIKNPDEISQNPDEISQNPDEIFQYLDEIFKNPEETFQNLGEIFQNLGEIFQNLGETFQNLGEIFRPHHSSRAVSWFDMTRRKKKNFYPSVTFRPLHTS